MAKPFKVVLWIVGILLTLIVVAAIALPLLINPNNYKPQIAQAVKDQTGRELSIGEIKLTIFPWLGADVHDVVLGNAAGFGPQPFAQVGEAHVSVKLLPLIFHRQLEVGTLTLKGLALNLEKNAQGLSNWADLAKTPEKPGKPQPEKPAAGGPPLAFSIGGLQVKDANLSYADKQSGASYQLKNLDVDTGEVRLGQPMDVKISFKVASSQPQIDADTKAGFTLVADADTQVYELRKLKLDVHAQGAGVPGGKQDLGVSGEAKYQGKEGAFALTDGLIEALGMKIHAALSGSGLNGESPALSGKINSDTFNPRETAKLLGIVLPAGADASALSSAGFAADYSGTFKSATLDHIVLTLDQTKATGQVAVTDFANPAIAFELKADSFDADRYLGTAPAGGGDKSKPKADGGNDELPLDALDKVNAKGSAELGAFKFKGLKMSKVRLTLDARKGQVKVQELGAQLYGGKIAQSAHIAPGAKPRVELKLGLAGVNAQPLLKDFNGKDFLSGAGNWDFAVSTAGKTTHDLLAAMNGTAAMSFVNGALEGINVRQVVQQARALAKGQPAPAATGPARTEFADLKATGTITNGVLKTNSLNARGDGYTLGGDGSMNLAEQTIDYTLKPTVTGGGSELEGTTIPVRLTGSLFSPSIKVDLESVLKARARQEVDTQIKKQGDKLKEKYGVDINNLFKKK